MIHIAVVEDENIYAEQLEQYIRRYGREKSLEFRITRFQDGDEIVEKYAGDYDMILMDIQMQFMDGMTAAEKIRERDPEVAIMFITNMTEYAIRGYEVDALDYVVKPVEYFAFARKMDRAVPRLRQQVQRAYISVPTEGGVRKLDLEKLLYMEIQDHTLIYHTADEMIRARGRGVMREAEETLQPHGFFRCNNCYLVNLRHVESVKDSVCQVGAETIQVSRSRKKAFMNALVQSIGAEN